MKFGDLTNARSHTGVFKLYKRDIAGGTTYDPSFLILILLILTIASDGNNEL